jgi:hypothetical protein
MNGWDLFTWLNRAVLAAAAITIFGFFLRDAKGILTGKRSMPRPGKRKRSRTQIPIAPSGALAFGQS